MTETVPKKRVCIFCGGSPVTKEHHPPKWINECFSNVAGARRYFQWAGDKHQRRGESKNIAANEIKHVCARCNNGWMRTSENLTKPILCRMIQGESVRLRWRDQVILSHWLVKSALTMAPSPNWKNLDRFKDAYKAFYRTKQADDNYEIHVGACDTNNYILTRFDPRDLTATWDDGQSTTHDAFYYTVMIGHFVATVAYAPSYSRAASAWPGGPFVEIWPGSSGPIRKNWPPPKHIDAQAVNKVGRGPHRKLNSEDLNFPNPPKIL